MCLSIGKAKVAHAEPCKPGQGRGEGGQAGRRAAAWLQGCSVAKRRMSHCIIFTPAPGPEDGDGYEVPSPSQGTDVLEPLSWGC